MNLFAETPMTPEGYRRMRERVSEVTPRGWWFPFGRSILGQTLWCFRLGEGEPRMLYVAGHHGMEWLTSNLLLAFAASDAVRNFAGTLYLVPCLNPDGAELQILGASPSSVLYERQMRMNGGSADFSHWQSNARGVDLNHNYPAGFDAYRQLEESLGIFGGCPTRYSGAYPLSEPETAALAYLTATLAPDAVLTLHTQGRELFWGADPCRTARLWGEVLARRVGYRVGSPAGAAAYGGFTDMLAEWGVPALTVECGFGRNPLPLSGFFALWEEVLPLLCHASHCLSFVNKL